MNYYNPFFYTAPATSTGGLISRLFGSGKISTFLTGTSKTLNFINQALPVMRQVSPMLKNAKSMFKVMTEFSKTDVEPTTIVTTKPTQVSVNKQNGPVFFV